jgi:enamine deaminase RidA (YjgF/YER057c/UK114 family)
MSPSSTGASSSARVEYLSPPTLARNPAFSQVVVVSGGLKTLYLGGQNAIDASGAIVGRDDLAAQTERVLANVAAALAAAGAKLENVVKWNILVVQGHPLAPAFQVFQRVWGVRPNPPAITAVFVAALANPAFLIEIDAIAAIPE